jgi:hypothetical protein
MFKKKPKPQPREIVTYRLVPGGEQPLTIVAAEPYSAERLTVEQGEKYIVLCAPGQDWVDWFLHADPLKGCWNPPAVWRGMRVRGVRCFTLCAAFKDNDDDGARRVPIGESMAMPDGATFLSFFANDCEGYYDNNYGSINITVKRIL